MDVNQVELNHDRTQFATCSDDGTVRIWKLPPAFLPGADPTASTDPQGKPILCIGHWAAVCGIAWRPNTPDGANEQVGS
jgi:WD40 repeat protein